MSIPPNTAIARPSHKFPIQRQLLRKSVPAGSIPPQFDCRTAWGPGLLLSALNQGQCGSCFIFSATEVLRNRLAIEGRNGQLPNPSQQIALECNPQTNNCTNGGDPESVFQWMCEPQIHVPDDTVPGGNYTATVASCPAHVYPKGFRGNQDHPVNVDNSIQWPPSGQTFQRIDTSPTEPVIDDIKREIMTNGPVSSIYIVGQDMMNKWFSWEEDYIYSYDNTSISDGLHAIQIIGWGSKPEPYWLIMNSWGSGGINGDGTFKVAIGTNGCGFEKYVVTVDVSNAQQLYATNAWQWNAGQAGGQLQLPGGKVWYIVLLVILVVIVGFYLQRKL